MTKRKGPLGRLKRLPTFTVTGEGQLSLRSLDPMFRFSLTRLIESSSNNEPDVASSPGAETRFAASFERQFRQEWQRIRDAVHDVFQLKKEERKGNSQPVPVPVLPRGHLASLHNDIRMLLRSQAGTFIFEYYQNTLLPAAISQLLEQLEGSQNLGTDLVAVWNHFYCTVLPTLEAIFIQVKNQKMSVRQATLLAFRDHVLLKLESQLELLLEDMYAKGNINTSIKQMLLVLQSVIDTYPPSDKRLRTEALLCRVVSPYLGHRGLYENGHVEPVVISRELDVAHLRRPSVEDPRRLSRPLSVNTSCHHLETLSDLFELSANRAVHKRTYSTDSKT